MTATTSTVRAVPRWADRACSAPRYTAWNRSPAIAPRRLVSERPRAGGWRLYQNDLGQ